jgi:hypothetical protein
MHELIKAAWLEAMYQNVRANRVHAKLMALARCLEYDFTLSRHPAFQRLLKGDQ